MTINTSAEDMPNAENDANPAAAAPMKSSRAPRSNANLAGVAANSLLGRADGITNDQLCGGRPQGCRRTV